jgi:pilus assembly protein CpaB
LATEVKPKSNRILLIFGIFLAALAFGLNLLLARTPSGATAIGGPKNIQVVVATKDILASSQITTEMVTIQDFSSDQAPAFAYKTKDAVVGRYAALPIHAGQAIYQDLLVKSTSEVPAAKQDFLAIPSGMVAMQIPTGELVGAGGYIQPDDRIDIIATMTNSPVTKITFTNLRIIRTGPAGGANTRGITSSLTVIVTPKQAVELKFLLENSSYKYVLKSVKDYDQATDDDQGGTDLNKFKNAYGIK